MKKQDITYQDKLNELRLDISHPNNRGIAFVLLEGESDIRLFRKLFNLDDCKVENIPGGKFKLEVCVEELSKVYPLIIGIRDADFIHLGNQPYSKANMFLTDFHDMEMMLISMDDVFSSLIFEYTPLAKAKHNEIRKKIMKSIDKIGYFKWLNENENLEYKFDAGFQDLISFTKLEIDFIQYFARILSKSPNAKLTDISVALGKIQSQEETYPNYLQLTNGHDFMKALSKFVIITGDGRIIGDENISSSLRMAFTFEHYKRTKLYTETKAWAVEKSCSLYIE